LVAVAVVAATVVPEVVVAVVPEGVVPEVAVEAAASP